MTQGISVVIPCFNAERYIAATLLSVLAQDWPALEVLVVDDGSNDGSAKLVEKEFPSVRLIRRPNTGVAAARNTGIELASHNWIAFIDADDIWLPGKLQKQMQLLALRPESLMVCAPWHVWPSLDPAPAPELLARLMASTNQASSVPRLSDLSYAELLLDCHVWTSTVVAHRSLFERIGRFDTSLRIGEDYDLWLRASRVTPIERLDSVMALYRIHPASITKSAPSANYRAVVIQKALKQWGYTGPDGRTAEIAAVQHGLAKSWSDYAGALLATGQLAKARLSALSALQHDRAHLPAWKILVKSWVAGLLPASRTAKNIRTKKDAT